MPFFSVRKSLWSAKSPFVFPATMSLTALMTYFGPISPAIIGSCAVWFSEEERLPATLARANILFSFRPTFREVRPTSRSMSRSEKSCFPASLFA